MISSRNHVNLIVEDKNGYNIGLCLYNSVDQRTTLEYVQKLFPKGALIGIKQPYKKLAFAGYFTLRNDNPANIIIVDTDSDATKFEEQTNKEKII